MGRRRGRRRGRHRAGPTRRDRVRRVAGVVLACAAAVVGVVLVRPDGPRAQADQRFVAAVRAEGHAVEPGENELLVIRAAHKLCRQRDGETYSERREATLSAEEVDAVRRTFGEDDRAFTKVALRTYCS